MDWREAFFKYSGLVIENEGVSFLYAEDWEPEEWKEIGALFRDKDTALISHVEVIYDRLIREHLERLGKPNTIEERYKLVSDNENIRKELWDEAVRRFFDGDER